MTLRTFARAAACAALALLFSGAETFAQQPVNDDRPGEYRSKNFVVTGTTVRIARRVAESAEVHRRELAKLWLGQELPDWCAPCRVDISLNDGRLGGASTFDFGNTSGGWSPVRVCLSGDLDGILNNCLPHEITHTILADYFRRPVPRWADEGACILQESSRIRGQFERMAMDMAVRYQLFRLDDLFAMRDYPQRVDVLYAQGYSLARFLVGRKDRATFLAFVRAGMEGQWAAAAKQLYGFESVESMQQAWLDTLRQEIAAKDIARK